MGFAGGSVLVGVWEPDTAMARDLVGAPGGTYSLRLLLRLCTAMEDRFAACTTGGGRLSTYALRFRGGEALENAEEVGEPWPCSVGDSEPCWRSGILDQGFDVPTGEGRGVMSERGPTPGEEATDPGDSPLLA